ncbi:hypothetical protein LR48_Vigan10g075100 [Vigna angularis]|uniref:Acyl-CoA dehydrogenase/oxidase C-terminal domain-containing protein n=1 Tax=Phaseolus angularis TaxID=3914 RepID=A0A0L9VJF2_PHAAN|nr:hypothetical protein LR48_Vigan10g075100 [Vigna angularis]
MDLRLLNLILPIPWVHFCSAISDFTKQKTISVDVAVSNMALKVLDMAKQVHGATGVSYETILDHLWTTSKRLTISDGPDEVHLGTIAKLELQKAKLWKTRK